MPMTWIEPEVLTVHRGVSVYHTYKNECADSRLTYWYTTDISGDEDFEFDVRELPVPEGVEPENHELVIAHAFDQNLIEVPDWTDIAFEDQHKVRADIRSTEYRDEVEFDADSWLLEASAERLAPLQAAGWCEPAETSDAVRWLEIRDYKVGGFAYRRRQESSDKGLEGFELVIKAEDAEKFLKEQAPEKFGQMMFLNKRAMKVSAVVRETITIEKSVTGYVMVDEPQFQNYLFNEETGELNFTGMTDLRSDPEFDEKLSSELRDMAYEQLITDGDDHGWEVTDSEGTSIDQVELYDFQ